MNDMRLIIPHNNETLLTAAQRELLEQIGQDADWMVTWVLYHWPQLGPQSDLEMYDKLFNDLENSLEGDQADDQKYQQKYAYIEENVDKFAMAAKNVYEELSPFLGQLPNGHPTANVYGISYEPFGKKDMVVTLMAEAVTPCQDL